MTAATRLALFSFPAATLVAATIVTPASAQKLLHTHVGNASQLQLAGEIRPAGDVDGDGFADYLLGLEFATPNGQGSGEVRIYSGVDGTAIRTLSGAAAGDNFGISAVGVGDVNGDGRSDTLVGAVGAGIGGEATLYSGLNGNVIRTHAAGSANDRFGADVANIGDVNMDNVPDYAVGADNDNTGPNGTAGAVYVYSGSNGALLFTKHGEGTVDQFGNQVRGAGDVDGDGRGDIVVGAPLDDNGAFQGGVVHLISGNMGATLWRAFGSGTNDRFGHTVDGAGMDMDGDGTPDVVAGTRNDDYVRVLSGIDGSTIREQDGSMTGGGSATFGRATCTLGDIDGDGLGDYAVGDITAYLLGQVRVYSGGTGDEIYVLTWTNQNDRFGQVVSNVGDLNGDGLDEFGVAAPFFDFQSIGNTGRVGIYSPQAPIGTSYCGPATVGSSGRPATISAYGSNVVSDNCFSLTANSLPVAAFGYFIAGTGQNSVMPAGSIGFVCIGGSNVARFNSMEKIIRGPGGSIEVDTMQIPGNPPRPILPGETWNFQCWFRDSNPTGGATSNFTNGVSVSFL